MLFPSVSAANPDCTDSAAPSVGHSVNALARWFTDLPGLSVTNRRKATVGGLHGVVMDIAVSPSWRKTCPWWKTSPIVPMLTGRAPYYFHHSLNPPLKWRLYLLNWKQGALAIEVQDVHRGQHLDRYGDVVRTFRFER
jgi:hypothetical protein